MRSSALRAGFDAIRLPGAGSAERRRRAEAEGLTVTAELWNGLCAVAESVGVEPPPIDEVSFWSLIISGLFARGGRAGRSRTADLAFEGGRIV